MEWGRAKTILIISFLCLNMLLGYQLWVSNIQIDQPSLGTAEIAKEIHQLMRDKGIELEAALPTDTPKLKEITVKFHAQHKPGVKMKLAEPLTSAVMTKKGDLKEALSQQLPNVNVYEPDPISSIQEDAAAGKHGTFVLNQLHGAHPMFEVRLELYYSGGMIGSYSQSYVDVQPGLGQKEQKVLSAITALGSLTENYLRAGTVIKDVRLGYHGQIYNSETQVLAPFWRIATSGGELFYVHAINGAVEVPQKEK
jgi:regulatory protein YycI of two-component signal transduction system YycFG